MDMSKYSFPRSSYLSMNPYEFHKHLINTYVLTRKGATSLLKRDVSRDRTDFDVIRENHRFLWDEDEVPQTWEERLAKKYHDKLFKEFCICDLSRYKENKLALRWQTEAEMLKGKGQFICGAKHCEETAGLRTWEVNFAYKELGEKKNALVKLRLCPSHSKKLNYQHQRKEVKHLKKSQKAIEDKPSTLERGSEQDSSEGSALVKTGDATGSEGTEQEGEKGEEIWKSPLEDTEEVSREEEFEKYLEHLLLL